MVLPHSRPRVPTRVRPPGIPFEQSFIIPVEAYGLEYTETSRRGLDIARRFLRLPTDLGDRCGNLLWYLQQFLEALYLDLQPKDALVPERWTQAGLSQEIWQEARLLMHMEQFLRIRLSDSRFCHFGEGPPIDNKKALNAWIGWISRVYESEIDLRRTGIPVDPPDVVMEQ